MQWNNNKIIGVKKNIFEAEKILKAYCVKNVT